MATDIGWYASPATYYNEKVGSTPEPGISFAQERILPVVGVQIDSEQDVFVYLFIRTTSPRWRVNS
jgi:hypothetical protein